MKKFKVKLIWEEVYECEVEAIDKLEAEELALEEMTQGNCHNIDSIYSDCEIKEIKL